MSKTLDELAKSNGLTLKEAREALKEAARKKSQIESMKKLVRADKLESILITDLHIRQEIKDEIGLLTECENLEELTSGDYHWFFSRISPLMKKELEYFLHVIGMNR